MKAKILFVFVFVALLLAAWAPVPATAWYASKGFTYALPIGQEYTPLPVSAFDTRQPGIVTLTAAGFETTHTGLINLSGTCRAKYAPVMLRMYIDMGGYGVPIIETRQQVVSFNVTVEAAPVMRIVAQHDAHAYYLPVGCYILFEAVE